MTLLNLIRSFFETMNRTAAVRLDAASEAVLSPSLGRLAPGQQGWVEMKQAQWLFSETNDALTLRKFNESGKRAVRDFAAGRRCTPRLTDDRVIFTRNANWMSSSD